MAVLKAGDLVESGRADEVLVRPQHPYTRMLLKAVPSLTPRQAPTEQETGIKLQARGLTKVFDSGGWFRQARRVTAADAVDLEVHKGETLGIVGESGSGKSTVARLLARLIEPSGGEIELDGLNITRVRGTAAREFRRRVQVVFQDPYRSLNPRRTVGAAISEGPINFGASTSEGPGTCRGTDGARAAVPTVRSTAIPTNFPAASANGSASRGPWPLSRRC